MAASKNYFAGASRRFLPGDQALAVDESAIFELDESDIWSFSAACSLSPDLRKAERNISAAAGGGPASLPVNVPDWSKILKEEYTENRRWEGEGGEYDEEGGDRVPPHVFLSRQSARAGIVCFSVHEGFGRTLKGRDLSRVRNAIWQKTGFVD